MSSVTVDYDSHAHIANFAKLRKEKLICGNDFGKEKIKAEEVEDFGGRVFDLNGGISVVEKLVEVRR